MEFDFHAQMNHFLNESKEKETSSLSIDTFAKKRLNYYKSKTLKLIIIQS
jgi:hypothetical protein